MAKTILFLVHGMGRHEPGWAEAVKEILTTIPEQREYAWFAENGGLEEHVDIVPIQYDDVFQKYLDEWGASTEAIRTKAAEFGVDLSRIFTWLETADEVESNFFWTHVVDVLLYRFFSIVTAEVRVRVRDAMVQTLNAAKKNGQLVSSAVLAHSLGTSVTHDSLALLGSVPIPTPAGPNHSWMVGNHTWDNIFMCANVGRVLETEPKVFQSVVRPSTAAGDSYVSAYYNFRHRLDPFPAVREFAPVGWGKRYVPIEDCEKTMQFNVHGFEHYLADPRVHVMLYRGLIGRFTVTDPEFRAARKAYDAEAEPNCLAELARFKSTAQKIIALAKTGGDPFALIIAGAQFFATAKEAKDACV